MSYFQIRLLGQQMSGAKQAPIEMSKKIVLICICG